MHTLRKTPFHCDPYGSTEGLLTKPYLDFLQLHTLIWNQMSVSLGICMFKISVHQDKLLTTQIGLRTSQHLLVLPSVQSAAHCLFWRPVCQCREVMTP